MTPSRTRTVFTVALTIVSGAVAGTVASTVFSRGPSGSPAPTVTTTAPAAVTMVPVVVGSQDDEALRSLESRVGSLEGARAASDHGSSAPPDLAAYKAEHRADHDAAIARHWQEPSDPTWSSKSAASLEHDLGELARTAKFEVGRVDCRTTSCLGVIEWASYGEARSGFEKLLVQRYDVNCAREIYLPEPNDPNARYEATVVFDCTHLRGGEP